MSILFHSFTLTGDWHRQQGAANQDCVRCVHTPECAAAVLSDGASGCRMGRRAAQLVCGAAVRLVEEQGKKFFRLPEKKLAWLLGEHLLYTLECAARADGIPLDEYGCTFSMVYLEIMTGRTVLIRLGDSAVFSVREGTLHTELAPCRDAQDQPVLVCDGGLHKALRIRTLHTGPGACSYILAADGLWQLEDPKITQALRRQDLPALDTLLIRAQPQDDCSYIALTQT